MSIALRILAEVFGENTPVIKKIYNIGFVLVIIVFIIVMIFSTRTPQYEENNTFSYPIQKFQTKKIDREITSKTVENNLSYYQKYTICKSSNPADNDETDTDSELIPYIENNKCKYVFNLSK
jgi:hypothetical protein